MNNSLTHNSQTAQGNPITRDKCFFKHARIFNFSGAISGLIIATVFFLSCEIQAQSSFENNKLPTKTNFPTRTTTGKLTNSLPNRAEAVPSQASLSAEIDPKLRQPRLSISSDDQFLGNDDFLKKFFSLAEPHGSIEIAGSVPIDLLFGFTRAPPCNR